ncbi:Cas1p-domain-containing protein [Ascodesmis nigricans]|uniref:Cas1p-domain-containing protein n=1 Tax=Ascodesmis nigricans TaxID=341454 RepID=A0A4V3SIA0_9PEZI|nr:Cas1p-domain-containing protein [Ascodesmis nigricans]
MASRLRALWNDKAVVHRTTVAVIFTAIVAVIFRYCFFDARDPSKCGALMNEGYWLDAPGPSDIGPPNQWQPSGCMLHPYKPKEISTCLEGRRVVFAGDSTIRQVFWAMARKLDPKIEMKGEKHADITVDRSGVKLQFYWDPFMNGTSAIKELKRLEKQSSQRPAIMLLGTGLWFARFESSNPLKPWKDRIDAVVANMNTARKSTDLTHDDFALLSPVPVPVWERLSEDRRKAMKPETVDEMNQYLMQLSHLHGLEVAWAFNRMTEGVPQAYESSGLHVLDSIAEKQAETLLNLRCNAELQQKYPYDRTCCNKYELPNWQQWAILVTVLAMLPVMSYLRTKAQNEGTKTPKWVPSENILSALLIFGFSLVFCFYADRTQVFNKLHKSYTNGSFLLLIFLTAVAGFTTLKKSSQTANDQPFLFRDQTDEWKGWMQFAILIYHYTGASKVPWIYGFIRVTVASYLFMTGYGHTFYFYKKGDYSFKRIAGVMLRLNLLSCALPYIMKTDYLFYYFAPLVSWWYFIVYFTMRIGKEYNGNTRFLLGKIGASAVIATAITRIPGILEIVFGIVNYIFRTSWDVVEWRFRVFLDMWIVYIGMLVAIAYIKLSDPHSPHHHLISQHRQKAVLISIVSLLLFFLFQTTRETKFIYNAYHPYISWIPILAFITLRNATPNLRNTYSAAFAWIGKCSLETFTLQFHIWLAADTKGLLDFGVMGGSWWGNMVVSTAVFLYTSDAVAGATGVVTAWIMGAAAGSGQRRPEQQQQQQNQGISLLPTVNTNQQAAASQDHGKPQGTVDEDAIQRLREEANARRGTKSSGRNEDGAGWTGLKARCALLLAALWVMNLTYSS